MSKITFFRHSQWICPPMENLPRPQIPVGSARPVVSQNSPGGHCIHEDAPKEPWYWPFAQLVQMAWMCTSSRATAPEGSPSCVVPTKRIRWALDFDKYTGADAFHSLPPPCVAPDRLHIVVQEPLYASKANVVFAPPIRWYLCEQEVARESQ